MPKALSNLGYRSAAPVGSSGLTLCYYEHKYHVPSDREIRRLLLDNLIAEIHERSRGTYGMLRIKAALQREHDMVVNKKLILSIMRELKIKGLPGPKTTGEEPGEPGHRRGPRPAQLHASTDRMCSGSPTSPSTDEEGKVYCCVVLDAFSRRWWAGRSTGAARGSRQRRPGHGERVSGTGTGLDHPLGPRQPVHVLGVQRTRPH